MGVAASASIPRTVGLRGLVVLQRDAVGRAARAQLPVESLAVGASGTVTGFPAATRFARIVVTPTVIGGDIARQPDYEAAANLAHDRCFIGHALAPEVAYDVGPVHVREGLATTADQPFSGFQDGSERPPGYTMT